MSTLDMHISIISLPSFLITLCQQILSGAQCVSSSVIQKKDRRRGPSLCNVSISFVGPTLENGMNMYARSSGDERVCMEQDV